MRFVVSEIGPLGKAEESVLNTMFGEKGVDWQIVREAPREADAKWMVYILPAKLPNCRSDVKVLIPTKSDTSTFLGFLESTGAWHPAATGV